MSDLHRVAENLAKVRAQIGEACSRSGRAADEVRLVGVTKYVGVDEAEALMAAGLRDLGESRPQELWRKAESLSGRDVRWHLIGHLQRNKVRRTLAVAPVIHSADSLRLLVEIDKEAAALGQTVEAFLEVNVSGEEAKHGLAPEAIEPLLPEIARLGPVRIQGLMTMASLHGGREQARRDFAKLRELRDRLTPQCPPEISLRGLSMGMSGDFDIAIEEGATIVRVGS
ncbi:MAG: YggS family pyridoxal phosphate-dependent enzyme, partial [Planctomycetes bacterium]|nr:YggS family pyridoxal phosphate-dependent enzyme [Planctomycetota bacterium]